MHACTRNPVRRIRNGQGKLPGPQGAEEAEDNQEGEGNREHVGDTATVKRLAIAAALFALGVGLALALQHARGPGATPQERRDAPPKRIVTTAPSVAELLFAIGAGERVVGVGDWCRHPPEARRLPRVGGEYNPALERMLALRPDLLVVQGKAEKIEAFCRHNAIRILHLNTDTLATLRSGLHTLGRAVGLDAEADRLAAGILSELAAVASRAAGQPRPRVFLCMGHSPGSLRGLSTAHGKSLLTELLDIAGGENVFGDVSLAYPPVSKDQLLERQPDVILDLHPGEELSDEARRLLLADWQAMASLPAVRNGRIHILTDDSLLVPGPRVPAVARRLAEVLHPDAMGASPAPTGGGSAIATGVSPWNAASPPAQPPQGAAEAPLPAHQAASAAPCGGWGRGAHLSHGLTPVAIALPPPVGAGPTPPAQLVPSD